MTFLKRYLIPRLVQYLLVIWLGITVVFIIPRLLPHDPVEQMVDMMQMRGNVIDPAATERTIQVMRELYGLEEGLLSQYLGFWDAWCDSILVPRCSRSPHRWSTSWRSPCRGR